MIAERVRTWPGAVCSRHPKTSFAAVGARAAELMRRHDIDCYLGEASPLGALDAATLLLGVGFSRATAFHLAEYRLPYPARRGYACAVRTRRRPAMARVRGRGARRP
jgi:aminoglycoside 3-N-acetyltransferase